MSSLWEKMRLEERKVRAAQLGIKVSDLEEMENLQETLAESRIEDSADATQQITSNNNCVVIPESKGVEQGRVAQKVEKAVRVEDDDDAQYFDKDSVLFKAGGPYNTRAESEHTEITSSELSEGGHWHKLPAEVVDRILIILGDIDMIGYLCNASKTTFRASEAVYQHLCMITYPMQTARKALQVEKWLTWRNMLVHRPRLRTNGFYTLRTKFSKGYCNDAFWEEKQFKSIEVKFYRHMRFFDHGRVLYSLDIAEPAEMARWLQAGTAVPKRIFEGRYTLTRREVVVEVPMHYCNMRFEMTLLNGDDGYVGKCNMLRLTSHSCTPFRSANAAHNFNPLAHLLGAEVAPVQCVEYTLPVVADLRFHRYWNFSARQHQYSIKG